MIPRERMKGDDQRRRVYSPEGVCPTLLTPSGGYFETKIATYESHDDLSERKSERQAAEPK